MIVKSDQFTLTDKTFVTEISSLGRDFRPFKMNKWSGDYGFQMEDVNTGVISWFYLVHPVYRDVDLTHWLYRPTPDAVRNTPALMGVEVHILND